MSFADRTRLAGASFGAELLSLPLLELVAGQEDGKVVVALVPSRDAVRVEKIGTGRGGMAASSTTRSRAVLDADLADGTLLLGGPRVGLGAVLDLVVVAASGVEAQLASSEPLRKNGSITRHGGNATAAALLGRLVDVAGLVLVLEAVLESGPGAAAVADLKVVVVVAAVSCGHATTTYSGGIANCNSVDCSGAWNAFAVSIDDHTLVQGCANAIACPFASLAVLELMA